MGMQNKEFDVPLNKNGQIIISNMGVNPHSFVIDELGIDSGVIPAGQNYTISLDNLTLAAQDYNYYSKLDAENANSSFTGKMTVINR